MRLLKSSFIIKIIINFFLFLKKFKGTKAPKAPMYDQTDSDELRVKIDEEWIASEFVDQQLKAMFDLAAANRDATALRACILYDRTVRGANFKVRHKVV